MPLPKGHHYFIGLYISFYILHLSNHSSTEVPGRNVPLDHKRVRFNVPPTRVVDLKNGYFREEWEEEDPDPYASPQWNMNDVSYSRRPVPVPSTSNPVTPVYYPVPVPVQVPQVPVHSPMMYYAPIVTCNCPCCLNGCPGPAAHYLAYQNSRVASSDSKCVCKVRNNENNSSREIQPAREKLNYVLQAKASPRYNPIVGPLIDVSVTPMTYIYERYDRKKLDELATEPALQEMKIVHQEWPWQVNVRSRDVRGITIRDVLDAIYHELNIPVSEEDAEKMRGHWLVMRYREQTSDARRTGDRYAGLKRMHWMRLENHNLIGLEPYKTDKWLMVFEKPESK